MAEKPPSNLPRDTLNLLPDWHQVLVDRHFKGLNGLYVRHLMDAASAAERSAQGKRNAQKRHKDRNKIKAAAKAYYLENRSKYTSSIQAAADLSTQFGEFAVGTYENWVSKWSA